MIHKIGFMLQWIKQTHFFDFEPKLLHPNTPPFWYFYWILLAATVYLSDEFLEGGGRGWGHMFYM